MSATVSKESRLLKVILLGDGGVGKSSIMNRFIHNKFDAFCYHTIGVEFLNKDIVVDGVLYTLQIWDTAGQERFRALRTPFYRGSDICLLTFSVDDPDSFKSLNMWQKEFLYYGDVPEGQPFPFLLLGNKCDIPDEQRLVSKDHALSWCARGGCLDHPVEIENEQNESTTQKAEAISHTIPYVETSAKDAINVEEGFCRAVQLWQKWDRNLHNSGEPEEWNRKSIRLERPGRNANHKGPISRCCS